MFDIIRDNECLYKKNHSVTYNKISNEYLQLGITINKLIHIDNTMMKYLCVDLCGQIF